uniref:Uncharacterized protein n=1 Tax=Amphora coffeiformis TaxID=265554 RepID=A0A7S3L518_9STRA|eukprot:scaffold5092_cov179-Amphora_coffeaeformis.AAC.2
MRISPRRSMKKVLTELSAPARGVGPRTSFASSGSFAVADLKNDSVHTASTSVRSMSVVQFDEKANEYYEPQIKEIDPKDKDIYYTAEETATFRKECTKLARLLRADQETCPDDDARWTKILLQAYQGFCDAETADEVMNVFESNKVYLSDTYLGLDSWVIRQIHVDRIERKRQLISKVHSIQSSSSHTDSAKAHKMGKASKTLSRPSRLYAHHLALLVAGIVEQENS